MQYVYCRLLPNVNYLCYLNMKFNLLFTKKMLYDIKFFYNFLQQELVLVALNNLISSAKLAIPVLTTVKVLILIIC